MAGVCTASGKCHCDHWASGSDCSYLDFKPIDKQRLGYTPLRHSTWCGSVLALWCAPSCSLMVWRRRHTGGWSEALPVC